MCGDVRAMCAAPQKSLILGLYFGMCGGCAGDVRGMCADVRAMCGAP